jgi:hypothetical protein
MQCTYLLRIVNVIRNIRHFQLSCYSLAQFRLDNRGFIVFISVSFMIMFSKSRVQRTLRPSTRWSDVFNALGSVISPQ